MVTAYTDGKVTLRSNRTKVGYHEAADMSGYQGVEVGDFVVHGLDILRGSAGVADSSGAITSVCTVCEPIVELDPRYVSYVIRLQAASGFTKAVSRGVREGGADFRRWGTLAELPILFPPLEEQRAIADYLDRETAQIDSLIEKQSKLLDLLEYRFLSEVRTSTSWADDFGWPKKRISWLFQETGSGTTPANEELLEHSPGRIAWVTTGELRENLISSTKAYLNPETVTNYSALKVHPRGSLLVAMYGATVGRMAVLDIPAATNQACCALVGPVGVSVGFVQFSLLAARDELVQLATGGGQPNISQDKLRTLRIPVPELAIQERIAEQLLDSEKRTTTLAQNGRRLVELAQERRAALITAAVTGQIDVSQGRAA